MTALTSPRLDRKLVQVGEKETLGSRPGGTLPVQMRQVLQRGLSFNLDRLRHRRLFPEDIYKAMGLLANPASVNVGERTDDSFSVFPFAREIRVYLVSDRSGCRVQPLPRGGYSPLRRSGTIQDFLVIDCMKSGEVVLPVRATGRYHFFFLEPFECEEAREPCGFFCKHVRHTPMVD